MKRDMTATQLNAAMRRREAVLLQQSRKPLQRTFNIQHSTPKKKSKRVLDMNNAKHEKPVRVKRRVVLVRVQEGDGDHPYRVKWINKVGDVVMLPLMTAEKVRAHVALLTTQNLEFEIMVMVTKI